MTHFTRTSWTDAEIDAEISDPKRDDLLTAERLCEYLGITKDGLKYMIKTAKHPFLTPYRVYQFDMYRISDLRRMLKWRKMVWNAAEMERMHNPHDEQGDK